METGEYFLTQAERQQKNYQDRHEKMLRQTEKRKRQRAAEFEPPRQQKKIAISSSETVSLFMSYFLYIILSE
jgi:hypothetical protein